MGALNVALWLGGVALMLVGLGRARAPLARYRALQANNDNIRRDEQWRGGRREDGRREITGADVMREELRRQLRVWVALVIAGVVLILVGFALNP